MQITLLEPLGISDEKLQALTEPLRERGHSFTAWPATIFDAELIERAKTADAIIVANRRLHGDILCALPDLRFISVAFTGVDHVDLAVCRAQGIAVSNASGYSTDAVAELTLCFMLSLLRNVAQCDNATREGFTKDGLVGGLLKGRTVGIVGTGAIGLRVAALSMAFGARCIAYAPRPKQAALDMGLRYVELDELMATADIVTLHVPLNESTKGMIDGRRISLMKPSAYLLNMARGPVLDSTALALALEQNRLAGAGIDVYEKEPPIYPTHPLLGVRGTLCTPHIAYATVESLDLRAEIAFDNVLHWLDGQRINKVL